jgi:oligopeptide transport system permease protein
MATMTQDGWRRLRRNRAAWLSLYFLGGVVALTALGPWCLSAARVAPSDAAYLPPGAMGILANGQRLTFWLGSDDHGKDVLTRVLLGGQVSLAVGGAAAVVNLVIGVLYGLTSGYLGGRIDAVMMRAVDLLFAVPRILIIMVLIAAYGDGFISQLDAGRLWGEAHCPWWGRLCSAALPYNRMLIVIASLGLIEWLTMARIVRGQILVLRELQFVTAARAMGQSGWRIMIRHLLPNLWTLILTYLTLTIPAVILTESFLSFLGLGIDEPAASWGSLLKAGAQAINPVQSRWWLLVFPAAWMAATLLALNFVGDGLRDAFDPKSERGH